jgi:hypothetical protein
MLQPVHNKILAGLLKHFIRRYVFLILIARTPKLKIGITIFQYLTLKNLIRGARTAQLCLQSQHYKTEKN